MQTFKKKEYLCMEQPKDIGTKTDLYKYRLESSKEALESAKILMNANSYKAANNRAYYAIFHAINAVHALNGVAYKRHKDALANFNKEYVKIEIKIMISGKFQYAH